MGSEVRYDDEQVVAIIAIVCDRIAAGEPLRQILNGTDPSLPHRSVWFDWVKDNRCEIKALYDASLDERTHFLADQIIIIADALVTAKTPEEIRAAQVRIDARKWATARMMPTVYGDKTTAELTGAGGGPIMVAVTNLDEQL